MALEFGFDWLLSRQRVHEASFVRVWKKTNHMMITASSKVNAVDMLAVLFKRLARLVDKATILREHPRSMRRISSLPAADTHQPAHLNDKASSRIEQMPDEAPVEVSQDTTVHNYGQWIPPILVRISKSVAEKHTAKSAFVRSMQQLLNTMLRTNPYSYMQVIYSPPPPEMLAADEGGTRWRAKQSSHLQQVTAKLATTVSKLLRYAYWLENPQKLVWPHYNFGWQQLHMIMMTVHEMAAQFHVAVLYLYSLAMGREDYRIDIDAQVSSLLTQLDESGRYGLPAYTAIAKDHLERESYTFCPEVLVYLDAWRDELPLYEHGFAPREQAKAYLVNFSVRKSAFPTRLSRMARHLNEIWHAWNKTRLGTPDFTSMHIQEIGELEKTIKKRLERVVDYFYEQNIAKWTVRREMDCPLPLVFPDRLEPSRAVEAESASAESVVPAGEKNAAVDAAQVEQRQVEAINDDQSTADANAGFRKPGVLLFDRVKRDKAQSDGSTVSPVKPEANEDVEEEVLLSSAQPLHGTVLLPEIYAWSDAEIDAHEQETERIYALQSRLTSLYDQTDFQRVLTDVEKKPLLDQLSDDFYMDKKRSTLQLIQTCVQLRPTVTTAVAFGEEIALHGAAEALIQRPSLRTIEESSSDESNQEPSEAQQEKQDQECFAAEMRQILREARARVDSITCVYDGVQSSESYELMQVITRSSQELLALASGRRLMSETIESNGDGAF